MIDCHAHCSRPLTSATPVTKKIANQRLSHHWAAHQARFLSDVAIAVLSNAEGPLDRDELVAIDAWWRAANYLAVGQIYLSANPLLREPLQPKHIKPRPLGHFGPVPGLNLVCLNDA